MPCKAMAMSPILLRTTRTSLPGVEAILAGQTVPEALREEVAREQTYEKRTDRMMAFVLPMLANNKEQRA